MAEYTFHTDVDFCRDGKQTGFVDVPYSEHGDAWGVLQLPICVIKNGSGPSVYLQAGNHGDEYEGPIVLGELIRDLEPETVQGRLIIMPAINLPAVTAGNRVSPIDGLNFNRTFPGKSTGTTTEQISGFVHDVLFEMADVFIDLHSGGSSLKLVPSAILEPCADPDLAAKSAALVRAFDAPMQVVISNYGDPRTSTAAAVAAGLATLGTEMGGGGTVSPEAVKICRRGVQNVLRHLELLAGAPEPALHPVDRYEIAGNDAYVRADDRGIFEPFHGLGTPVCAGQEAGRIHFVDNPARRPHMLTYGMDGVVYGLRQPGMVRRGNCCAVVASRVEGA
ncbi:MAG TPA: succinylglutamate desuccinylase [Devosia sp.]|nr:succinylglutamate desuccinylase [Devosia sp.]